MEPIGTITMYFPFLEGETTEILQDIMNNAYNYYDFVQRLNERVLSNGCPDSVIYFAIHHSALLLDIDSIDSIAKKYGKIPILRPNLFYASVHQGNSDDTVKVHESADAILSSNPPIWLAADMRCLKFEVDMLNYPQTLYDTENLDALMKIIQDTPGLKFYETTVYDCLREKAVKDGDTEEVIRCVERAIESAEEFDDVVRLAYHLRTKFAFLQYTDRVEARKLLIRARDIMESLGHKAGVASMLYFLSKLEAIRGEYNSAIDRNLEVISIREAMELPKGPYSLMLSTLHNVIRNPESGLEWARMAEVDFEHDPAVKPRAILNQAWALILMGKNTEALILIDSVRETIMKSGLEILLGWLSFVSGVYEMSSGDYESAARSIEDAIEVYEKKGSMDNLLIFHHHLAKIDVMLADISSNESSDGLALPWLALLEEKAVSEDLPGILGQVHLLKAELALALNDDDGLRLSIDKIRSLGKESSMEFLNDELDLLLLRT
ncbi:MAG: hypothetical protein ACFFAY_11535 [Promethearchaeota archaeon]